MKTTELRQKTKSELEELLITNSKELFNLRMQKSTQQLTKPDLIKKVRREIARTHTLIKQMAVK